MSSGLFKNNVTIKYLFTNHTYLIYVYKQGLALNNQQGLICLKTQPINHVEVIQLFINLHLNFRFRNKIESVSVFF